MRYHALACDYDGTIAHDGRVAPSTVAALERVAASGRRLILVTGREPESLERAFDRVDLFDRVVAENGGLLYRPATKDEHLLTSPADPRLVERLQGAGVEPLSVGKAIVATWEPNDTVVLEAIRDLGLELEIIFNKGAVMVLPTGVTKASGLQAALRDLGLSPHDVVGVGDAENDHAFLVLCEVAATVGNALDSLKQRSDLVLRGAHGDGVEELIERLLDDDLASVDASLERRWIGFAAGDDPFVGPVSPREKVLVTGASGGGKSTLVTAFVERLAERGYQYCLVDPEGDYEHIRPAVSLGRPERPPTVDEVVEVVSDPDRSVVVGLLGLPMEERPAFFDTLLAQVTALRVESGRPHWIIADEAHHLVPSGWQPKAGGIEELAGVLLVTVHPEQIAQSIARGLDLVVAVGDEPAAMIESVAGMLGIPTPSSTQTAPGEALAWRPRSTPEDDEAAVVTFRPAEPTGERKRHRRTYAEDDLGLERIRAAVEERYSTTGP
jgi:HAD superfamily hydrolase (TIGR01484 family)